MFVVNSSIGTWGVTRHEFSDDLVPKVLQSGALRIVEPAEFDVPEMDADSEENGVELKLVKPERVIAVFFGDYTMERE